jgi:hypothetical protein
MKKMSLNLINTRFKKFKKNYKNYLNIAVNGTEEIYTHRLDLIEIYCFLYNIELTTSDMAKILNIEIDTAEFQDEDIAEERDDDESEIDQFIGLLKYRVELFNDSYPFIISESGTIKLVSPLSNKNKTYIILLLSSNLNRFKEFIKPLTDDFEDITYFAVKKIFGENTEARAFGSKTLYIGLNTRDKLKELSKEMNIKSKDARIDRIPITANKDKGLDVVAWLPFKDGKSNMPMIFIQCASGINWEHKLSENRQIASYLDFQEMIANYGFAMPFEFSTSNGEFEYFEKIESGNNILFDRSRLLQNLNETNTFKAFEIIDKILANNFIYE